MCFDAILTVAALHVLVWPELTCEKSCLVGVHEINIIKVVGTYSHFFDEFFERRGPPQTQKRKYCSGV